MTKEEFSEMTLKQKLSWFFTYYGLRIAVITAILVVIGILVKSVLLPAEIEDACVLIYSDAVSQDDAFRFEGELEESTGKTVSIQVISISDPYGQQALAAKVGCDVLDVIIAPENEMKLMSENGYLLSYAPVEGSNMYMGIPGTAREGDLLETVINYLNDNL